MAWVAYYVYRPDGVLSGGHALVADGCALQAGGEADGSGADGRESAHVNLREKPAWRPAASAGLLSDDLDAAGSRPAATPPRTDLWSRAKPVDDAGWALPSPADCRLRAPATRVACTGGCGTRWARPRPLPSRDA